MISYFMILLGAAQRTTWPNERAVVFRSACYGLNGVKDVSSALADIAGGTECIADPLGVLNAACVFAKAVGAVVLNNVVLVLTVVRRKIYSNCIFFLLYSKTDPFLNNE